MKNTSERFKTLKPLSIFLFIVSCTGPREVEPIESNWSSELGSILTEFMPSHFEKPTEKTGDLRDPFSEAVICKDHSSQQPFSCEFERLKTVLSIVEKNSNLALQIGRAMEQKLGNITKSQSATYLQQTWGMNFLKNSQENLKLFSFSLKAQADTRIPSRIPFLSLETTSDGPARKIDTDLAEIPISLLGPHSLSPGFNKISLTWNYTSQDQWILSGQAWSSDCDFSSAYLPRAFTFSIKKDYSIWKFQTGSQNTHWSEGLPVESSANCTNEKSDSAFLYWDIIAKNEISKASLYILKNSTPLPENLDQIRNFPLKDFCSTFSLNCAGFLDLTSFITPGCFRNDTKILSWNDDCSTTDSGLSAESFQTPSSWLKPSEIENISWDQSYLKKNWE
jgi:hypothetical protein